MSAGKRSQQQQQEGRKEGELTDRAKSTTPALHHIAAPLRCRTPAPPRCGAVPSLAPTLTKHQPLQSDASHPPRDLRVPVPAPAVPSSWPPPATSPRRSASPRCPAAAPLLASWPSSGALGRQAPRFREALLSGRRPAARAPRRRCRRL